MTTTPNPATQADQHVCRAKLNMLVLASKGDLSVWDRHVLETEIERDLQIAAIYSRLAVAQADNRQDKIGDNVEHYTRTVEPGRHRPPQAVFS